MRNSKYISTRCFPPALATLFVLFSICILIFYSTWWQLWIFSASQAIFLALFTGKVRMLYYAVTGALLFSVPLLFIHGIVNPQFPISSFLWESIPIRIDGLIFAALIGSRLSIITNSGIAISLVSLLKNPPS